MAVVMHGVPRTTFDVDILIEPSLENAGRLLEALREAGFGTAQIITPEELIAQDITIFNDRVPIDVQTHTPGIEFAQAWNRRETMEYQGRPFHVVSRQDLLASKRATGREKDQQDVQALEAGEADRDDAAGSAGK